MGQTEEQVRQALYGPDTRSQQVSVVDPLEAEWGWVDVEVIRFPTHVEISERGVRYGYSPLRVHHSVRV